MRENNVFTYQTCDSKELGIQMADMFVGAYRKQEKYAANDNTTLIPFNVTSMIDTLAFKSRYFLEIIWFSKSYYMEILLKRDLTTFQEISKNELGF